MSKDSLASSEQPKEKVPGPLKRCQFLKVLTFWEETKTAETESSWDENRRRTKVLPPRPCPCPTPPTWVRASTLSLLDQLVYLSFFPVRLWVSAGQNPVRSCYNSVPSCWLNKRVNHTKHGLLVLLVNIHNGSSWRLLNIQGTIGTR